jgi:hypothetical protein
MVTMANELMWVCALLPDDINRELVDICREVNRNIGLPEDVFRFPLHISMKKSFRTKEFEPHVSLFTRGANDKMVVMQKALADKIAPMDFSLEKFVVGASGHKDEFIKV